MNKKIKALIGGMAPGILGGMGVPFPPGMSISDIMDDEEEQEQINPFVLLRQFRELDSLSDKEFRTLVTNVISNPENVSLSKKFLDAAQQEAMRLVKG